MIIFVGRPTASRTDKAIRGKQLVVNDSFKKIYKYEYISVFGTIKLIYFKRPTSKKIRVINSELGTNMYDVSNCKNQHEVFDLYFGKLEKNYMWK